MDLDGPDKLKRGPEQWCLRHSGDSNSYERSGRAPASHAVGGRCRQRLALWRTRPRLRGHTKSWCPQRFGYRHSDSRWRAAERSLEIQHWHRPVDMGFWRRCYRGCRSDRRLRYTTGFRSWQRARLSLGLGRLYRPLKQYLVSCWLGLWLRDRQEHRLSE